MLLEGHYQNAYVTRDIEKSLATFRTLYGVQETKHFQTEIEVKTPAGSAIIVNELSFIWIGNLQYELIEPVSGAVDIYREALPEQGMRLHHVCMRTFDWERTIAELDRHKLQIVLEGNTSTGLKFVYADARATLGHYLEFVWMPQALWTAMGRR